MLLPSELQKFSHPTLIVLADHIHAKLWLAHELELKEVDHLEMPRELKSDNEASFVNTDHGSVSGPEPDGDEERLHHFIKELTSRITHHASTLNAKHLYLAMKPDLMHALEKELNRETNELINRRLPHDLMKEEMTKVVERLVKNQ